MRFVDLFAGAGGFSTGAVQAGGELVFAANHWDLAVRTHKLNHPAARHECQDLTQYPWASLPDFDILLSAPACQPHSSAAQGKRVFSVHTNTRHNALRATAWATVDCIEVTRPKAAIIENVPHFMRWGKYDLWKAAIEQDGYVVTERVLLATHCGVPQRRKRLLVVAIREDMCGARLDLGMPEVPAAEPAINAVIRWQEGNWRPISQARPGAQERMLRAKQRFGTRCLSQHVTGHPGIPTHEAIRTITTQDQWVAINGDKYRPLLVTENYAAMGFPPGYKLPPRTTRRDALKMGGNAVPPPMGAWMFERVANAI